MMLELSEVELTRLLEGLLARWGVDLRGLALAPLRLRLRLHLEREQTPDLAALEARALFDEAAFARLRTALSPQPRPLFWDTAFHRTMRSHVLPIMRTYPSLNLWLPACATGEQVYAMAIVLREEGLLERSHIWATDENDELLQIARAGRYPALMAGAATAYVQAGGRASLDEYFTLEDGQVAMRPLLRDRVVFAQHSLVTDASFQEFQMILCRDVLSSFDRALHARVLGLFHESLCQLGVLALGRMETLAPLPPRAHYAALPCPGGYRRMDP